MGHEEANYAVNNRTNTPFFQQWCKISCSAIFFHWRGKRIFDIDALQTFDHDQYLEGDLPLQVRDLKRGTGEER